MQMLTEGATLSASFGKIIVIIVWDNKYLLEIGRAHV